MDVMDAWTRILRSCGVAGSEFLRLRDNISINGGSPPVTTDLRTQHRVNYYTNRILNRVEFPIQLRPHVSAASVEITALGGGVASGSYDVVTGDAQHFAAEFTDIPYCESGFPCG